MFFPRGLAGRLYWLAVLPFHGFIFAGMARRITATAEAAGTDPAAKAAPAEPARPAEPAGPPPAQP